MQREGQRLLERREPQGNEPLMETKGKHPSPPQSNVPLGGSQQPAHHKGPRTPVASSRDLFCHPTTKEESVILFFVFLPPLKDVVFKKLNTVCHWLNGTVRFQSKPSMWIDPRQRLLCLWRCMLLLPSFFFQRHFRHCERWQREFVLLHGEDT